MYIIYNTITGKIRVNIYINSGNLSEITNMLGVDEAYYISDVELSSKEYYFPAGIKTLRPKLTSTANTKYITADGADLFTFGNTLPNPTNVNILTSNNMVSYQSLNVTDGTVEVSSTVPGELTIIIEPPYPYQGVLCNVTVVPVGTTGVNITYYKPANLTITQVGPLVDVVSIGVYTQSNISISTQYNPTSQMSIGNYTQLNYVMFDNISQMSIGVYTQSNISILNQYNLTSQMSIGIYHSSYYDIT